MGIREIGVKEINIKRDFILFFDGLCTGNNCYNRMMLLGAMILT
jgi:hypothetical protein